MELVVKSVSPETLKTATINAANYIGAGKDIGSIENGKLADILVLDKNHHHPLSQVP